MNIWHYRDYRDTWLYYHDMRIFIITLAGLIATSVELSWNFSVKYYVLISYQLWLLGHLYN